MRELIFHHLLGGTIIFSFYFFIFNWFYKLFNTFYFNEIGLTQSQISPFLRWYLRESNSFKKFLIFQTNNFIIDFLRYFLTKIPQNSFWYTSHFSNFWGHIWENWIVSISNMLWMNLFCYISSIFNRFYILSADIWENWHPGTLDSTSYFFTIARLFKIQWRGS